MSYETGNARCRVDDFVFLVMYEVYEHLFYEPMHGVYLDVMHSPWTVWTAQNDEVKT